VVIIGTVNTVNWYRVKSLGWIEVDSLKFGESKSIVVDLVELVGISLALKPRYWTDCQRNEQKTVGWEDRLILIAVLGPLGRAWNGEPFLGF